MAGPSKALDTVGGNGLPYVNHYICQRRPGDAVKISLTDADGRPNFRGGAAEPDGPRFRSGVIPGTDMLAAAEEPVTVDTTEIDALPDVPAWLMPKDFDPAAHLPLAYAAAAAGECDAGIAATLNISERRLSQWRDAYEILAEVIEQGRAIGKRDFAERGNRGIEAGPLFNQRAYEFQGHLRFGMTGPAKSVAVVDNTPQKADAAGAVRAICQTLDQIVEIAARRASVALPAAVIDVDSDAD